MKEVELDGKPCVEIEDVTCIRETDKAILCKIEDEDYDGDDQWIPLSQVHDNSEVYQNGDEGKLIITKWIATQKGFI